MHIKDDLEKVITKAYKTLNKATIALASLTLLGLSAPYLRAQDWETEVVDEDGIGSTSIVSNNLGGLWISYVSIDENGDKFLKYAFLPPQNHEWENEIIEEAGNLGIYGGFPDIDLNSNNNPSIVYYNYNDDTIYVVSLNPDSTWTRTPVQIGVTSDLYDNAFPKIKFDSEDNIHILFTDTSNEFDATAKHAKLSISGDLEIEIIDHLGASTTNKGDLTIDNNDILHAIFYFSGVPYQGIEYATLVNEEQEWLILPFVPGGISSSAYISIDCNSDGVPYTSHHPDTGELICSYLMEPGSWPGWIIDTDSDTTRFGFAQHSSIAIDDNNNPSITYSGGWTEEERENILMFSSYNGQIWEEPTVVDSTAGYGPSLTIHENTPHISYIFYRYISEEESESELRYATRSPAGIEDETSTPIPKSFSLSQNYPNPFNPSTTIGYLIPEGSNRKVLLDVYNLRGQHVKTLEESVKEPGSYSVRWDGTNNNNNKVNSGVYLYTLYLKDENRNYEEKATKKMVLLK